MCNVYRIMYENSQPYGWQYCVAGGSVATDGDAGWPLIIHITAIIIRSGTSIRKAGRWSVYASNQVEGGEEGCYCGNF